MSLKVCEAELTTVKKGVRPQQQTGGRGGERGGCRGGTQCALGGETGPAILLGWMEHAVGEGEGEGGRCQGLGESDCS